MTKNIAKIVLDIALAITLALLYNTQTTGLAFHEIAGLVLAGAFLVHIALSWKSVVAGLTKFASRTLRQRLNIICALALFVTMALVVVSGLFISEVVLPGGGQSGSWRVVHEFCAGLVVILVGAHLALNWSFVKGVFGKMLQLPAAVGRVLGIAAAVLVLAFGSLNIATSGFASLLTSPFGGAGRSRGDFGGGAPGNWDGASGRAPSGDRTGFPGRGGTGGVVPGGDATAPVGGNPTALPSGVPTAEPSDGSTAAPSGGSPGGWSGQRPSRGGDYGGSQSGGGFKAVVTNAVVYLSMMLAFGVLFGGIGWLVSRGTRRQASPSPAPQPPAASGPPPSGPDAPTPQPPADSGPPSAT
ncbi:MAG: DUF4405 domain-containing protein [Propionibacteriaceae bacterium]|jgi:hypothetical protein|nr:DUF4405 domain-containing protein [Propionibacteriaceae bacterium]